MSDNSVGWRSAVFVLDVDGVMTTSQFACTPEGNFFKVFGPDDHDALPGLGEKLIGATWPGRAYDRHGFTPAAFFPNY